MSCILDDMDVTVIPETDHYVGQCICSKCTCKKHRCPAKVKPSHARGAFASSYQRSFRRHSKNTPPSRPAMIYKPNPHKMDLKTTTGTAYLPYELEAKPSQRPEAVKGVSSIKVALSARKLYRSCVF